MFEYPQFPPNAESQSRGPTPEWIPADRGCQTAITERGAPICLILILCWTMGADPLVGLARFAWLRGLSAAPSSGASAIGWVEKATSPQPGGSQRANRAVTGNDQSAWPLDPSRVAGRARLAGRSGMPPRWLSGCPDQSRCSWKSSRVSIRASRRRTCRRSSRPPTSMEMVASNWSSGAGPQHLRATGSSAAFNSNQRGK